MILYHGSNIEVTVPDLSKSRPYKDFGKGFYLSADKDQALRLAQQRVTIFGGAPVVNPFEFDEHVLTNNSLKVKLWEDYCEEWGQFVINNRDRNTPQPCHDYDIVYGPIADDGVTYQIRRHLSGMLSLKEMVEELKYAHGITYQYYFGSPKALAQLTRL